MEGILENRPLDSNKTNNSKHFDIPRKSLILSTQLPINQKSSEITHNANQKPIPASVSKPSYNGSDEDNSSPKTTFSIDPPSKKKDPLELFIGLVAVLIMIVIGIGIILIIKFPNKPLI